MLENWGITPEESREAERKLAEEKATRDKRICTCGHPAKAHSSESNSDHHKFLIAAGRGGCRPSKIICPCLKFSPVIESGDTRRFIFKTTGPGPLHALSRGIQSAVDAKIELNWVEGARCGKCHKTAKETALYPIALTLEGKESPVATPINVIFCGSCRAGL